MSEKRILELEKEFNLWKTEEYMEKENAKEILKLKEHFNTLENDRKAINKQIEYWGEQTELLKKADESTVFNINRFDNELSELRKQFIEKNRGINSNTVNDNAKLREMINVDLKKHSKDIVELQEQITELKEHFNTCRDCRLTENNIRTAELQTQIDELFNTVHGVYPSEVDGIKKQITELKEWKQKEEILGKAMKIEINKNIPKLIESIKIQLGINEIKEVLQELLSEVFIFTYPEDPEERKKCEVEQYRRLIRKLSGELSVNLGGSASDTDGVRTDSKPSEQSGSPLADALRNEKQISLKAEEQLVQWRKKEGEKTDVGGERTQTRNLTNDSKPDSKSETLRMPFRIYLTEEEYNIFTRGKGKIVRKEDLKWLFDKLIRNVFTDSDIGRKVRKLREKCLSEDK